MAGSKNDTQYSSGYNLLPITVDSTSVLQQETTATQIINVSGSPEGVQSANMGSIACDRATGNIYRKESGSGSTGWALIGSGSSTTLPNHSVALGTGATSLSSTGPIASSGIPLVSNGASSDPSFTTAVVAGGGTGRVTLTNHGVLVGAGTADITQLGTGSSGQVLQSGGASADPAYSTATYPSTATGTGTILRADGTNWTATTSTYPNTNAINTLLYASSANVMSALATANRASLSTNSTGVPTWLALTDGQVVVGSTAGSPAAANLTAGTGIDITNGSNSISVAVSGSVVGQTITGNTGGALSPTAGNWNLPGNNSAQNGFAAYTTGSGSTLTINSYGTAKWVVNPTSGVGTHTTIASAITSASSGETIFITPGTYTENLTLKAGVNLTAFESDSSLNGTGNVIISGTCTLTTAGTVTISGIQLQTNSAALLAVTGSAASIVNINNCYLNCTNNTGITFSSSSSSARINLWNSFFDIGTTGIALFSHSSAGTLTIFYCSSTNSGGTTTSSTVSAGSFQCRFTTLTFPVTTSSTGGFTYNNVYHDTAAQNTTALTHGGSNASNVQNSYINGGSASAVSIGGSLSLHTCVISSTNTNCITGAGTLNYQGLTFPPGGTATINTTTQTNAGVAKGSTTTAPTAGMIGEQIRATVASGSAVALTTATPANITSISLTAGIWDVSGVGQITTTGASTIWDLSVNTTSATVGTAGDNRVFNNFAIAAGALTLSIPSWRLTISSTTTVYLVAQATFTTGAGSAYGRISATRVG